MELPVFALHTVLFPGATMGLRVFEPRYLALMDDVLPAGSFAVVAIKQGREVGGGYEAHRVGVTVTLDAHVIDEDGTHLLRVAGCGRVALIAPVRDEPYPVWKTEPFPDEGGAGTDDVEAAVAEMDRYLAAAGEAADRRQAPGAPDLPDQPETREVPVAPHDPVAASYLLAAATPGLVPHHQVLLEIPGAGERLSEVRATFRREAALVRTLGAGLGGAGLDVSTN
ncbi:MAG: LON peptidase substrate-binding domain-containing protein [Actinomycetota bacterium]